LFVLSYWCLVRGRNYLTLGGVIAFEVVFGMLGFFAEFRNSILTLLVAAIAARPRLRVTDVGIVAATGILIIAAGVFWSSIKQEYRTLLSEGTGAQVVLAPLSDRVAFLGHAAGSMDGAQFANGFSRLVARHGYIEFLGLTMENVPVAMPHENGQLTLAVLQHITMPRFLFPEKPALPSDTEIMAKYTGMPFDWDEYTSISIGHLGELYVDFGFFGGLIAMSLAGWFVGFVYRKLRSHSSSPLLITAGFCVMVALPIAYFGTGYPKLIGSFVFSSAIALAMQRYGLPILLPMLWGRPVHRESRFPASPPRG
jgi:hypothetical protein